MNIASVKPGDIVLVNHKGRKFYATVENKNGRTLTIKPHERNISWRSCTSREVERRRRSPGAER